MEQDTWCWGGRCLVELACQYVFLLLRAGCVCDSGASLEKTYEETEKSTILQSA